MSAEDIASIGIRVDTTQVRTANRDLDTLTGAAARTAAATESTRDSFAQMQRTLQGIHGAINAQTAALRGFTAQTERTSRTTDQVTRRTQESTAALRLNAQAFEQNAISSRQMAAALRGVPAQFTDIATSIAAGQNPMMVLLQQGGQLKDMFGGLGPAVRALGSYMLGMVNPISLTATAIGVLTLAYYQGSKEIDGYVKALALSGNTAGKTGGQMAEMAGRMGKVIGTQGEAAKVLATLAASTKIAGDDLERFGVIAAQMEKRLGIAVDDTVKAFEELARSPVAASEKLNEKYRYLTLEIYRQIKALEQQGQTEQAARVAQQAYADAFEQRAKTVTSNLGTIERAWAGVVTMAKKGWDAILDVGRASTPTDQLAALRGKIEQAEKNLPNVGLRLRGSAQATLDALKEELAAKEEVARLEQRSVTAKGQAERLTQRQIEWEKEGEKYLSRRQKFEQDIAAAINQGLAAQQSAVAIAERVTAIRKEYADLVQTENDQSLAAIQARAIAEEGAAKRAIAAISAQYDMRKISEAQYLDQMRQAEMAALDARRGSVQAQLTVAKGQEGTIREQQSLLLEINKLEQERLTIAQKYALAEQARRAALETRWNQSVFETQQETQADRAAEDARALDAQNAALKLAQDYRKTVKESNDLIEFEITLLGKTEQEREAALAQYRIQMDLKERLLALDRLQLDAEEKKKRVAELTAAAAADMENAGRRAWLDDWKRINADVGRSLTDELMRGGRNAGDLLEAYFKTLTLRPLVELLVSPISGAFASAFAPQGAAANAAGGSAAATMTWLDYGRRLYQGFSGGFEKAVNGIGSAVQQVGDWINSPGMVNFGTGIKNAGLPGMAGTGTGAGQAAGMVLQALASMLASRGVSSLIAGDYRVNHGQALMNIGMAGGVIGGAITGLINRMFGRKAPQVVGQGIDIDYDSRRSGADLTDGSTFVDKFAKGGWLRSDKRWTERTALSAGQENDINIAMKAMKDQLNAFAASIGDGATRLEAIWTNIHVNFVNTGNAEADRIENEKRLQAQFQSTSDQLAAVVLPTLGKYQQSNENATQTLERLAAEMAATDLVLLAMGKTSQQAFGAVGAASLDARDQLVQFAGGLDALSEKFSFFVDNFYSEQEKMDLLQRQLQQAMTALGQAVPTTRAAFKQLVEGQDLSTEAGRRLYAALLDVAPLFDRVADAAGGAAPAIDALADKLAWFRDNFTSESEKMAAAAADVDAALGQLGLSGLRDADTFAAMVRQFEAAGDAGRDMLTKLLDIAPAFRQLADHIAALRAEHERLQATYDGLLAQRAALVRQEEERLADLQRQEAARERERELSLLEKTFDVTMNLLRSTTERMRGFATSLKAMREQLLLGDLSPLTPQQRYQTAQANLQGLAARAQAGDLDAIEQIQAAMQEFLQASRTVNASGAQYSADFAWVQGLLATLETQTDAAADTGEATIARLEALREGIDATNGLLNQQLSVAELAQRADDLWRSYDQRQREHARILEAERAADLQREQERYHEQLAAIDRQLAHVAEAITANDAQLTAALGAVAASTQALANQTAMVANATLAAVAAIQRQADYARYNVPVTQQAIIENDVRNTPSFIRAIFQEELGRDPRQEGLNYWVGRVLAGATYDQVRMEIRNSPEGRARGSHAGGLPYVPYDGYQATLHRGEAVVTAEQRIDFSRYGRGDSAALVAEIRALRAEVERLRAGQDDQTATLAQCQYDAADRAANKIVDGTADATTRAAWADRTKPTLR